jgi:endonuclease/exonuclease/phosphatase family metal-dependent hydrolase
MSRLPVLPVERRRQIAGLPASRSVHDRLFEELPFLSDVEMKIPPTDSGLPKDNFRVIAWNAERCRSVDGAVRFLEGGRADLILMTEMDWGMARSGQLHTSREMARRLNCGYAFAIEFIELGLGDAEERKLFAGQDNSVGYHGAALLFRTLPLTTRVIRLERPGGWFGGSRGERRVGGRIALLARFTLSGVSVTIASAHLESDTDCENRADQMRVLLDAIESYGEGAPALIGGDLNTFSMSRAELEDQAGLQRALARDPDRLSNPVGYEPLFELALSYGYSWESANRMDSPTRRQSPMVSTERRRMKIDWFLVRGLACLSPEVVPAVDPADGSDLSDHEAIAVSVFPNSRAGT